MKYFIPCKECMSSSLYRLEDEPLFYCGMMRRLKYYTKMEDMYKDCPYKGDFISTL